MRCGKASILCPSITRAGSRRTFRFRISYSRMDRARMRQAVTARPEFRIICFGKSRMPTIDRDGVKIYYEVHGSGPPLLLTHGYSSTSGMWQGQIAAL